MDLKDLKNLLKNEIICEVEKILTLKPTAMKKTRIICKLPVSAILPNDGNIPVLLPPPVETIKQYTKPQKGKGGGK